MTPHTPIRASTSTAWRRRRLSEYTDNYLYPAFQRVDLVATRRAVRPYVPARRPAGNDHPHLHRGDDELRELVRVLPHAHPGGEDGDFAELRVPRRPVPRGLPYAVEFGADVVGQRECRSTPGKRPCGTRQLFGIQITMGKRHAEHERDGPCRRAVQERQQRVRSPVQPTRSCCRASATSTCCSPTACRTSSPFPRSLGNRDDTISIPYNLPLAAPPLINAAAWPKLYRENTGASLANTLADYATYYWATDLRGMVDNVITGRDPAPWQHLNFAALSLGTEGTLNAKSTGATEALISAGTLLWPTPAPNACAAFYRRRRRPVACRRQRARTLRQCEDLTGAGSRHHRDPARPELAQGHGRGRCFRRRELEPDQQPRLHRVVRRFAGNCEENGARHNDWGSGLGSGCLGRRNGADNASNPGRRLSRPVEHAPPSSSPATP